MYAYIKGKLEYKMGDHIVIEAGGIGYKIFTPLSTLEMLGAAGSETKVYTHFYVREDMMNLYGFFTQEELGMFELLISVSGIGPKAAMSLISSVSPSKFGLAVITDDARSLTRAQGIGNKMAQRIILELKDKIKKEQLAATGSGFDKEFPVGSGSSKMSEAISALMVLGYTQLEANRAVTSVYSDDMELEVVVRTALRNLARH